MTSEWKIAPLGEIARNVSRAFNFKNKDNVVFINTGDVLNGEFLHFNKSSVKGLPGQAKKAIANKDILYSEIRPGNKRYVFVRDCFTDDIVVSTKFMVLETKGPVIPEYLYLVLTSQECESEFKIIADSRSGTFPQITFDSVSHYPIKYPLKSIQKKIFEFDGALTSRIKINNDINQTLEQMAQALFKSWFVDFEPVKAKMAVLEAGGSQADVTLAAMTAISGKDADALAFFERKHPEQYAELKATAELFPSVMQGHELGEIPEGWQLNRLSNLAILHYGKALKKTERIEGPYPVYGSGGITGSHNNYLVEGPSIIVGRKGSIGTLYWEDGKFHPIDTVYFVEGKDEIPLTYLYYLMKTLNLSGMNTDAAVPGLNRDNVYRLEVLQPDKFILSLFDKHMSAIRNNIQKNDFSTVILSDLRDTLLPKLLSGEITLPEAEQIISEEA